SLPGFLRQHYTTSSDMASLLSAFLISNGATDTRYGGAQSKPGRDAKQEARQDPGQTGSPEQLDRQGRRLRPASSQDVARPDTNRPDANRPDSNKPDAKPQQAARSDPDGRAEPGRHGRNARRSAQPAEAPDGM